MIGDLRMKKLLAVALLVVPAISIAQPTVGDTKDIGEIRPVSGGRVHWSVQALGPNTYVMMYVADRYGVRNNLSGFSEAQLREMQRLIDAAIVEAKRQAELTGKPLVER